MILSQGQGSEFVVINPKKNNEVVSDVLLLFPLKDKTAMEILRVYVESGKAPMDITQAYARYAQAWESIEDIK